MSPFDFAQGEVGKRTGQKVEQHLTLSAVEGLDGGFMKADDIERAHEQGVEISP